MRDMLVSVHNQKSQENAKLEKVSRMEIAFMQHIIEQARLQNADPS